MEFLPVEESACYRAANHESGKLNPSGPCGSALMRPASHGVRGRLTDITVSVLSSYRCRRLCQLGVQPASRTLSALICGPATQRPGEAHQ